MPWQPDPELVRLLDEIDERERKREQEHEEFMTKLYEVLDGEKIIPSFGIIACNILYSDKYSAMLNDEEIAEITEIPKRVITFLRGLIDEDKKLIKEGKN
ncbi:MAG: hypothetical protein IJS99_02145 [Synergistaceae bacterium]|nr:hypothetical protein [Synergistaceae bacterium]